MTPTVIVGYLALFFFVGAAFVLLNLLIGWLVRPRDPNPEKVDIYECGEPTIGSSFVQFDLRFYVVALLFLIFDVEVAFFFPWANVYGTSLQLMHDGAYTGSGEAAAFLYERLGAAVPAGGALAAMPEMQTAAGLLGLIALCDIAFFFAVLMVGFAYVWSKGDIDWVRATIGQPRREVPKRAPPVALREGRKAVSLLSE